MPQSIDSLDIPEGHVHRSVLIGRGWTAKLVDQYLLQHAVRIPVPTHLAGQISNKVYPAAEVDRIERDEREVHRAVHARDDELPRHPDGFTPGTDPTISRRQLIDRGWTPAHIKRLLGSPDATAYGPQRDAYLFDRRRVDQAEATDAKLRKRLDTFRAKRAEAREAEIEAARAAGNVIFRRYEGSWALEGKTLTPGAVVTVTRRAGNTTQRIVGAIIENTGTRMLAYDDGAARPAYEPRAKGYVSSQRPAGGSYDEGWATPVNEGPQEPKAMLLQPAHRGDVVRLLGLHGEEVAVITSARRVRVHENDPSVYGSHLLSYEGEWATLVTYRPATDDEAAPVLAWEATEREAEEQARQRAAHIAELRTTITDAFRGAERPAEYRAYLPEGERLRYDRTEDYLYGHGDEGVVGCEWVWLVRHNGADGDSWSENNIPGCIGYRIPRESADDVVAAMRELAALAGQG